MAKVTSTKDGDPRGWIISVAYKVNVDESMIKPLANSDALYASWVDVKSIKKDDLAFDHFDIISYVIGLE